MMAFLWFALAVTAAALVWSEVARMRAGDAAASYKKQADVCDDAAKDANKRRDAAEAGETEVRKRAGYLEKELEITQNRLRMFGDQSPVREELDAYRRCFGQLTKDEMAKRVSVVDGLTKRQNELVTELQHVSQVLEHRTKQLEESRFQEEWAKNRRAVADAQNVVLAGRIRDLEDEVAKLNAGRQCAPTGEVSGSISPALLSGRVLEDEPALNPWPEPALAARAAKSGRSSRKTRARKKS
jgi:predicted transglutaminase-like cysteine proteinase